MSKPKPHRLIFLTKTTPFNFLTKEKGDRRYWPLGKSVPSKKVAVAVTKKPGGGRA